MFTMSDAHVTQEVCTADIMPLCLSVDDRGDAHADMHNIFHMLQCVRRTATARGTSIELCVCADHEHSILHMSVVVVCMHNTTNHRLETQLPLISILRGSHETNTPWNFICTIAQSMGGLGLKFAVGACLSSS
jgi:hypothetical protein